VKKIKIRMTTTPLSLLLLLCASTTLAIGSSGFRLQLHHVDANATMLPSSRGITAPILEAQDGWEYIAEFDIGSPPQRVQAIVDPMSDLVWTQTGTCRPKCFAQELDYYNVSRSFTGHPVPCDHSTCAAGYETKPCMGGGGGGDNEGGACQVREIFYHDGVAGVLRTDIFTFGAARVNITFGCLSKTNAASYFGGASGVLGLGRGAFSMASQVGGNRFSYCLTRFGYNVDSSALFVGSSAGLGGDSPVTSFPFAESPRDAPFSSFYYMPLAMIGFGGWLSVPMGAFRIRQVAPGVWTGGVIVDTSTPFLYLVEAAHRALRQRVSWQLGNSLVTPPVNAGLEFCVAREDVSSVIPPLILRFGDESGGDQDLVVPPENYWVPVDHETSCMAVFSSATVGGTLPWNETSMIGTLIQENRHVLFDLEKDNISFQAADCSAI
jgi:hypothetical protein